MLRAQGFQVAFFDNCVECPGRTIEECGQSLNRFLRDLAGEEGEADLVAHSMGGLIVRAYLAGKTLSGYAPPAKTRIRKVVFLGVPHFGSYTAVPLPLLPVQVSQLAEGSPFVWDLSTWNVGADDLRGVDALGIAGAGCPLGLIAEASDGVVAVTSASLAFAREPERTRVLPYRHSPSVLGPCPARTALANIDSASHLSYRAIVSFLGGSEEWRAIGLSASEHPALAATGGGIVEWQDEMGNRVSSTRLLSGAGLNWAAAPQGRYQLNRHPAETTDLWFETAGGWTQNGASIASGGSRPYLIKWGPWIGSARAEQDSLVIGGANLAGLEFTVNGQPAEAISSAPDSVRLKWTGPAGFYRIEASGPAGRAALQWYRQE